MQLLEKNVLRKTSNNGKALSNISSSNSGLRGEGVMVNKQVRKIVMHLIEPPESLIKKTNYTLKLSREGSNKMV